MKPIEEELGERFLPSVTEPVVHGEGQKPTSKPETTEPEISDKRKSNT